MAFTCKILTQNGIDNTNIDGARAEYFAAGMRDGIIKGSLNECAFTSPSSNVINLDSGVLLIAGHTVVISEGRSWEFTSRPSNTERRAVIAEIAVDSNSAVTFRVFEQLASVALIKNNMFEHENGAGTYQVEIGRFTLTTAGLVEDVVRTLDIITGNSRSGYPFDIGTVTAETLAANVPAEADAEFRDDPEQGKTFLDFYLGIPAGATIDTIAAGTPTQSDGQTVTPITVTLTDGTTRTFNITATNGQTGATGVGISSITAGTPTQSGGQTVTPITVTLTDSNTLSFNITSTNGTNGVSVTNVQLTDLGGSSYKITTTLSDGTTIDTGNITIPTITIDSALSTTSENSVQNKVITNALGTKQDSLSATQLANIDDVPNKANSSDLGNYMTLATNQSFTGKKKYNQSGYPIGSLSDTFIKLGNTIEDIDANINKKAAAILLGFPIMLSNDAITGAIVPDETTGLEFICKSINASGYAIPAVRTGNSSTSEIIIASKSQTISGIKTFTASPVVPTPTTGTQAANKDYVDKRWTFSGGIKFNNETYNDGTILAIFKAPSTGTYSVEASMVKDYPTGNGGISFSVPTDPSKLDNNYVSGWFPSLSGTTMKFQRNMESRTEDGTFDISMNADDKLLIIGGHTGNQPNLKVTYTCTITLN